MPRTGRTWFLLVLLSGCVAALAACVPTRSLWPWLVGVGFLAGGCVLALRSRPDVKLSTVLVFAIAFRLMLVGLPPTLSDDAYRYIWDGLVQVKGINPYRYTPDDPALATLHDEPIYALLNSKDYFSVYPPVSQAIFLTGALVSDRGWLTSYYVIKALLVLFELLALLFLARMIEARALMLYAWNPLVLVETAGQAHTESALVLFLVLAVYCVHRRRGGWAALWLALAGWVKLYPFLLFPFLWRRFGWRSVWVGGLTMLLAAAPYAAPYVVPHVRESVDLYVRLFEFNAGFYYSVKEVFRLFTGADWSKQLGPSFRMLFLALLPLLYLLDIRRRWPIQKAFLVAIGSFFVLATTVHPWYLLGVIALAAMSGRPVWHWHWLGVVSLGTYLLYVDGPYWTFVVIGWAGWLLLLLVGSGPSLLQALQQERAKGKVQFIRRFLPRWKHPLDVLDLGAGEGYVGQVLSHEWQAHVQLADVIDFNRTELPMAVYNGRKLDLPANCVDVTLLYFVLHHAEDPSVVLKEAMRVARLRVIVVESVYEGIWDHRLLRFLDRLANRLRSGGLMRRQEPHLAFRTEASWQAFFAEHRAHVLARRRRGRWVHKQVAYLLQA